MSSRSPREVFAAALTTPVPGLERVYVMRQEDEEDAANAFVAWVALPVDKTPDADAQLNLGMVVDTLVELAPLARGDGAAWKKRLVLNWGHVASEWIGEAEQLGVSRFEIGLRVGVRILHQLSALKKQMKRVAECNRVCRSLSATASGAGKIFGMRRRLRVPVCIVLDPPRRTAEEYKILVRHVLVDFTAQLEVTEGDVEFVVEQVRFALDPKKELTGLARVSPLVDLETLDLMSKIAKRGVVVRDVPAINFRCTIASALEVTQHLDSLLSQGIFAGDGAETLTFTNLMDPRFVFMGLTLAQQSQSLTAVRLLKSSVDLPFEWNEVAYALLSSHASHNIRRFEVDFSNFTASDLRRIKRVLTAKCPLQCIVNEGLTSVRRVARATRFFLFDPFRKQDQHEWNGGEIEIRVFDVEVARRVHRSNSAFSKVLLPGWGFAWAR